VAETSVQAPAFDCRGAEGAKLGPLLPQCSMPVYAKEEYMDLSSRDLSLEELFAELRIARRLASRPRGMSDEEYGAHVRVVDAICDARAAEIQRRVDLVRRLGEGARQRG